MSVVRINSHIYDRLSDQGRDTVIFYDDRAIISGVSGHQSFKRTTSDLLAFCSYFLGLSDDQIKDISHVKQEGTVNKKRAIRNIPNSGAPPSTFKTVEEGILACDCSPTTVRKKIRRKFGWTDEQVNKLDLEDPPKEIIRVVAGMRDFCQEFLDQFSK